MTRSLCRSAAALVAVVLLSCGAGSPSPDATFTFDVRYRPTVDAMTQPQRDVLAAAVEAAADRIRAMITAGIVPVRVSGYDCGGTLETVRLDETVRGVVVLVSYGDLNSSATLASSGPCIVRKHGKLPLVSVVQFNSGSSNIRTALSTNDVPFLETVALHEMFHALGFGTVWVDIPWLVTRKGTSDPVYRGGRAVTAAKEFNDAPATLLGIPVENLGFQGTIGSHWRESTLVDELMTGIVNQGGANPLSHASIASLGDLGYHVDLSQADVEPAFVWPGAALRAPAPSQGISFGEDVIRTTPAEVDELVEVP